MSLQFYKKKSTRGSLWRDNFEICRNTEVSSGILGLSCSYEFLRENSSVSCVFYTKSAIAKSTAVGGSKFSKKSLSLEYVITIFLALDFLLKSRYGKVHIVCSPIGFTLLPSQNYLWLIWSANDRLWTSDDGFIQSLTIVRRWKTYITNEPTSIL